MNPIQTLPVPVIPLARDGAAQQVVLDTLSAYLRRNKPIWRAARINQHMEHALRMAAHASGMWVVCWWNPDTKKRVFVVVNKKSVPDEVRFKQLLLKQDLQERLKGWTK